MNLLSSMKGRAGAQARATIETHDGRVAATYRDSAGNVTAADVVLDGQVATLRQVPNVSGIRLNKGDYIKVNYSKGSRMNPQVIGSGGQASSAAVQAAAAAQSSLALGALNQQGNTELSQEPLLAAFADDLLPNAYVPSPGPNVSLLYLPGQPQSGGPTPNTLEIDVRPLVTTALPPGGGGLPCGTVLDLADSYGSALGMYRLDSVGGVPTWRRRDAGGSLTGAAGGDLVGAYPNPTLAGVITAGSAGDATHTLAITYDAKGRITAITATAIAFPVTSVVGRGGAVTLSYTDISGLGSAATHASTDFDASGAAAAAQASSLQKSNNLSDLASAATARTSLGLGTAAVASLPAAGSNASSTQVVRGDDTRLTAGASFAAPVAADAVTGYANTAVSPNQVLFLATNTATVPPATEGDSWIWQTSTNAGSTWSVSTYAGDAFMVTLSSGTVRARAQLSGQNGTTTGWVSSADVTYSAPATGGGGSGGALTWTKYTTTYGALAAAAQTNTITLFSLPAGGVIHAVKIKHSQAFNIGCQVSVGVSGNLAKYAPAFNVNQAVGNTVEQLSSVVGTENHGASAGILLTASIIGLVDDNFTNAPALGSRSLTYPTTAGAAGSTTGVGNGWTDAKGGVWSINSSNLLTTTGDSGSGTAYLRDYLSRPTSENCQDQKMITDFIGNTSMNPIMGLRVQSSGAGYFVLIGGGPGVLAIYRYDGTTGYVGIGTNAAISPTFSSGVSYEMVLTAVGINPTVLTATLYSVSGGTLTQISSNTCSDSTAALQTTGGFALTTNYNGGAVQTYSRARTFNLANLNAATSGSVDVWALTSAVT